MMMWKKELPFIKANNMNKLTYFKNPKLRSFSIVLILMIPVILYYLFFSAPRYVSSIILSVQSTSGNMPSMNSLASLLGNSSNAKEDVLFLQEYIHSLDMLKILDEKIHLKELYQNQKKDFFFKISKDTDQESFLEFYRNRVKIILNDSSGLLEVHVEGFTPEDAQIIAETILKESEIFVNEISHKSAREQMQFAESELLIMKKRLQSAKNSLLAFQTTYGIFDPLKQAEAKASLTLGLESEISKKEAELLRLQSYLNNNAPQIVMLKSELRALNRQLKKETSKIISSKNSSKLNDLVAKFQDLTIEAQFAQDAYTAALTSVETTRIESSRKIKQLVIVQSANAPQSPEYPRKLYNIITIFAILSLIYGTIKLILTIVEEHRF